MGNLFFWKDWPKTYRIFFLLFSGIFILIIGLFIISYINSPEPVISWEVVANLNQVQIPVHYVTIGMSQFEIAVPQYYVTQFFQGSDLKILPHISYVFLMFCAIGLTIGLSVVSNLKRFWYLISMSAFILLAINFKLDQLLLFGRTDNTALILFFVIYLAPSYYLHAFKPDVSFLTRLFVFGGITLLMGLLIFFFSGVERPFFYLANYGIFSALIISVLFIFLVSHEIIMGFLYITTGKGTRRSLLHFFARRSWPGHSEIYDFDTRKRNRSDNIVRLEISCLQC